MRRMREVKLVVVQAFATEWEAAMAKSALEAAGIESMIQADSVGGARSNVVFATGGFKVLVRDEDSAAAHEVLEPPKKRS